MLLQYLGGKTSKIHTNRWVLEILYSRTENEHSRAPHRSHSESRPSVFPSTIWMRLEQPLGYYNQQLMNLMAGESGWIQTVHISNQEWTLPG